MFVNCTGIIGMEAFKHLNLPATPILGSLQRITFFSPSGTSFQYDPGQPLAHVVSRRQFDQALVELAESQGACFRYGYHARLIRADSDGVEIRQREEDVAPVTAQMAVIATGFGSNLTAQVGLAGPRQIVYGAQVEVEMEGLTDVEIYLGRKVAPEAFAWAVPTEAGKARVGLITSKEAPRYLKNLLHHPALRERIRTQEPKMLLSPIPAEPIEQSYAERVLVVGEAAGQVKTTTQGGIYYGMLCAAMAAETAEEALQRKDFREVILRGYQTAWTRSIGEELKMGSALRQLFARLSDEQVDAFVELGTRRDVLGLVKRLAQFDWHRELIQTSLKLPALREVVRGGLW